MNETTTADETHIDKAYEQIEQQLLTPSEQRQTQMILLEQKQLALQKERLELIKNEAVLLSKSTLVPKEYQGNPANCMIALEFANRLRMSAMAVMQSMYVVNGRPAWSSRFMASLINACGRYTPIEYAFVGNEGDDTWGCYATAIDVESGKIVNGPTVTMKMARGEGWITKDGSKWKTMPELMLMYRAASFFAKVHIPEVTLGMQTDDEARDSAAPKLVSRSFDSLVVDATANEKSDVIDVEIE